MQPDPESRRRPLATCAWVLLALLGLGAHVGWRAAVPDVEPERFELGWGPFWGEPLFGLEWARGSAALGTPESWRAWRPWVLGPLLLLAVAAGWRGGRRWGLRGRAILAGGSALAAAGCGDPGLLGFVLERGSETAPGYRELQHLARAFGATALAAGVWTAGWGRRPANGRPRLQRVPPAALCLGLGVIAVLLERWLTTALLAGEPLTNDGQAYRWQAELWARGHWKLEGGAWTEFFPGRQIYAGEFVYSKYPPGHSLALALGARLGWMPLLPTLGTAALPALAFWIARRCQVARPELAACLAALCPMLVALSTLELSHGTSVPASWLLFGAVLCALQAAAAGRTARVAAWSALAGASLGVVLLARPGTAAALAVPLALAAWRVGRSPGGARATGAAIGAGLLGSLPALAAFAWINLKTTGDALLPAYVQYANEVSPNDRWGWLNRAFAVDHTLLALARQQAWLLGLAPGLALAAFGWARGHLHRDLALAWSLAPAGFYALLRFHGVPWAGPLYWSEASIFALVACAQGWVALGEGRSTAGRPGAGALLVPAAVGALAVLWGSLAPAAGESRARRAPGEVAERLTRGDLPESDGAVHGVLFVPLENEIQRRRFHLAPPVEFATGEPGARWWLARDLGPRNADLLRVLGDPPALRYDPASGRLGPWR
jgi:hypothetical protein